MVNDFIRGRAQSLNKTISEIMAFLDDEGSRPGGRGANLREFLNEKLADLAERWYRKGINRGHRECHEAFQKSGTVPAKLRYKGSREFFSGQEREIAVTSKIKPKRAAARRP